MSEADPRDDLGHLLIRASAGSGKTYRLTERYLGLLRAGATPDTVLATTFTRKAAGEILGRVVTTLAESARQGDQANRELLATVCRSLHRVTISTIDSFFFRLASSFRLELDLPDQPTLVADDHPTAVELRRQAIERVLSDSASSEAAFDAMLGLLRRLYHDQNQRSVTEALREIIDQHAEYFEAAPGREVWNSGTAPGLLDEPQFTAAVNSLLAAENRIPQNKSGNKPNGFWLQAWRKDTAQAAAGDWETFLKAGLAKAIVNGEASYRGAEITDGWRELYAPLIGHVRGLYVDRIYRQTSAIHELLSQFTGVYEELRQQHNVLLYRDVGRRLTELPWREDDGELLREIYYRLDARVGHLLLDEFQDTSLDQWRVFSPLANEITSDETSARSLFVVGDPKQAIYGWRGGCVELFDAAESLPGVMVEPMARSWRSSQVVLDVVNDVFGQLEACACLAEDQAAARVWSAGFDHHEAARDVPGYLLFEVTEPLAPSDADESESLGSSDTNRHHLQQAAARIQQIHEAAPRASLGVLLRNNASIRMLLHELRDLGLPASGEGGNPIADHPAVAAVLSALVMADHPGHGPAVFHTLNSPVGEVVGMRSRSDAHRVARSIRAALLNNGFAALIAAWTQQLAESCDATGLRRLTQLIEIAERFDAERANQNASAPLRPSRFVDLVEAARVEEPGNSRIRVMTIHKSKGLQFDAVVLPELDKELSVKLDVLVDRPDPLEPIEHVWRTPKQAMHDAVPAWSRAYDRERARKRAEDFSALYVAMTRPRYGLYLLAKPSTTPGLRKLRFATILRERLGDPEDGPIERGQPDWMLSQGLGPSEETLADREVTPPAVPPKPLAHRHTVRRMRPTVAPSALHRNHAVSATSLLDPTTTTAQQRGLELHAMLESVRYLDGVEMDSIALPLREVLSRPAVAAALSPRFGAGEELWRERSFIVADGSRLIKGVFDRVAIQRDERGQAVAAHLIDFKSDRVAANSEALASRVEAYRPQFEAYRQALARLLELSVENITGELVFTTPGVAVSI